MTAREKAIEAAAAAMEPNIGFEKLKPGYQHELRNRAALAAPLIESALLDRMLSEDAVQAAAKNRFIAESGTEGMWNRLGPKAKNTHYRLARAALTAVVAEIRQELAPAQSPEAGK